MRPARRGPARPSLACLRICLLTCFLAGAAGAEVSAAAADALGAAIYAQGLGERGRPVAARHAAGGWRLRGTVVACANCHGPHREGGREGAVPAPSLRWVEASPAAREQLRAALVSGRGRDGRTLDATMPRFDLEDGEFEALYAHLQRANAQGRGTAELPLYITLLPAPERRLPDEAALLDGLRSCFGTMAGGAAPSLRWELRTYTGTDGAIAAWRQAVADPGVAALVAPSLRGWRDAWAAAVGRQLSVDEAAPVMIFPFVDDPIDALPPHAALWLFGGPRERQRVLHQAREARRRLGDGEAQEDAGFAAWVATPARASVPAARAARGVPAIWADAACAAVMAMQQRALDAPGALAVVPAQRLRWALRRSGRLETPMGLLLELDRPVAVNDWAIWALHPPAPPRLVAPRVRLERGAERQERRQQQLE